MGYICATKKELMEKMTFTHLETGLENDKLKLLINSLIEANLNTFKLQSLSDWIKDSDCSTDEIEAQTQKLIAFKETIKSIRTIEDVELTIKVNYSKDKKNAA